MALYAIGDIQGCDAELGRLLAAIEFSPSRDRVWFVGDLVNRGPESLQALRRIRALGEAAVVVLGNHDLHLLAVAAGCARQRKDDTLAEILAAPDREELLQWLITRPLLHEQGELCLVHAGLPPQWDIALARRCAREFEQALQKNPREVFEQMYGDEPDLWKEGLAGAGRLRYIGNCFTRLRYLHPEGRLALRAKGSPGRTQGEALIPWFEAPHAKWRGTRVVFGHWSTLGFIANDTMVALDTGCVWGGSLTALRLDGGSRLPVQIKCAGALAPQ